MKRVDVLDHGFVALTDVMGDDRTAARCARTSFANADAERTPEQDARLTDYLVRNGHNTPLEFSQLRFYMKLPIFVARQFVRHRTASINEISYRYVEAKPEFYIPALERMNRKADNNKQGSSDELCELPEDCQEWLREAYVDCFETYEVLLERGLAPELARAVLPVATYTEWYWQQDLHNFLHMVGLRTDPHAQYEIRVYAQAMLQLAREHFPTAIASWEAQRG